MRIVVAWGELVVDGREGSSSRVLAQNTRHGGDAVWVTPGVENGASP